MKLRTLTVAVSTFLLSAYSVAQSTTQVLGSPCGGTAGSPPSLALSAPLQLGASSVLTAGNLPAPASGLRLLSFFADTWNGTPLPMSLQSFGMTGCSLSVRPDNIAGFTASGSSVPWTITVPSLASLNGLALNAQALFRDPAANTAGTGATAGLRMVIGGNDTPTSLVSSISQWGITWTFAQPVRAGQFVNGDWFVIGPVSIVDMQPPVTVLNGRTLHGAMVDPDPSTMTQGYDSDVYAGYYTAYDPARNKALNVSPQTPLVLGAGHSLVKAISNTDTTLVPRLRTAAVLTCLSAVPRFGSFRPPYAGTDHTVRFALDQVDWTRLLSLAPAAGAPSLANEIPKFQRMWLDQAPLWAGRMMHPLENMPDYGRDLAARYAQGALLCHTNLPLAQKQPLAISLIQIGIDTYGVLQSGGRWPGNGGHGSGRKLMILFAGALLRDPGMLGIGSYVSQRLANGATSSYFGEDCQTFVVQQTAPGVINFGYGGYTAADIGLPEWGFAHVDAPDRDAKAWDGSPYRGCCTANAWCGDVLCARMMGLMGAWNHQVLFDYTDRFMATQAPGWQRSWEPWVGSMWDLYRAQF